MHPDYPPIGIVHSCFKEKFGIPRQAGLAPDARASVEIFKPWDREEAFRGLETFSHVWILFAFHKNSRQDWRPTVRPPRLGGNKRLGVFATRSPFRPNPIGLSAVRLRGMERLEGKLLLHLEGADLLDGTPVLDIKPYVPYADAIADARGGFADQLPGSDTTIRFSEPARETLQQLNDGVQLRRLIEQILRQDPRPAYLDEQSERKEFGMRLNDCNIRWRTGDDGVEVFTIEILQQD